MENRSCHLHSFLQSVGINCRWVMEHEQRLSPECDVEHVEAQLPVELGRHSGLWAFTGWGVLKSHTCSTAVTFGRVLRQDTEQ